MIKDTAALVEDVKSDKVHGPDQFAEIAADECNGAEQDLTPGHGWPPDGRRKAAQRKKPEGDISGCDQAQWQIPARLFLELIFGSIRPVEMLVSDSEGGQNQRLLLGKKREAVGDKHGNVRKPRWRAFPFGIRETKIKQKSQKEKETELEVRYPRYPG